MKKNGNSKLEAKLVTKWLGAKATFLLQTLLPVPKRHQGSLQREAKITSLERRMEGRREREATDRTGRREHETGAGGVRFTYHRASSIDEETLRDGASASFRSLPSDAIRKRIHSHLRGSPVQASPDDYLPPTPIISASHYRGQSFISHRQRLLQTSVLRSIVWNRGTALLGESRLMSLNPSTR